MRSPGRDDEELRGTNSDSIFGSEDEYASDDGGAWSVPVAESDDDAADEGDLTSRGDGDDDDDDDDGGAKESSGEELFVGGVECPKCGKSFPNEKSMFGHLRSHPNRRCEGDTPPGTEKKRSKLPSLSPDHTDGSSSPSPASSALSPADETDGQRSGRDPQLTPLEIWCSCIMLTLRCRDGQGEQEVLQQPSSPERIMEGGIGRLATTSSVLAQVETEDSSETGNALICDQLEGPIVKMPKKRIRRSVSKEDREANRRVKPETATTKEKYTCKHCEAEFSSYQALGGHMARHHREKKVPAMDTQETSLANQDMVGQSHKGKKEKGADVHESSGPSPSSRRMQGEQLSMASIMGWLSRQAPGGDMRNDGMVPVPDDDDRNIDLNAEAPEQD